VIAHVGAVPLETLLPLSLRSHLRRGHELNGSARGHRRQPRLLAKADGLSGWKAHNSMMRELGGVFGIAVAAAVFAGAGSFASPDVAALAGVGGG